MRILEMQVPQVKYFIVDKNKKNVGTGLVGAPACGDVMKL